jgi:hypothetical protein
VAEEILFGGVANAGAVVRDGPHVLRPSNLHSSAIHRFLSWLHEHGFNGASVPVGIDADNRERLLFIEGDVPVPPYAPWAQHDDALASVAPLIRQLHDASRAFDPSSSTWSAEMADPVGGQVMCHNDVCMENVVFRNGSAVGLLDFDFAAPGRPVYDLGQFARMCVPIDDDVNAPDWGGSLPTFPPGCDWWLTPTVSMRMVGASSTKSSTTRSFEAARSFVVGWMRATPTSFRCGMTWVVRSASIVDVSGGPNSSCVLSPRLPEDSPLPEDSGFTPPVA